MHPVGSTWLVDLDFVASELVHLGGPGLDALPLDSDSSHRIQGDAGSTAPKGESILRGEHHSLSRERAHLRQRPGRISWVRCALGLHHAKQHRTRRISLEHQYDPHSRGLGKPHRLQTDAARLNGHGRTWVAIEVDPGHLTFQMIDPPQPRPPEFGPPRRWTGSRPGYLGLRAHGPHLLPGQARAIPPHLQAAPPNAKTTGRGHRRRTVTSALGAPAPLPRERAHSKEAGTKAFSPTSFPIRAAFVRPESMRQALASQRSPCLPAFAAVMPAGLFQRRFATTAPGRAVSGAQHLRLARPRRAAFAVRRWSEDISRRWAWCRRGSGRWRGCRLLSAGAQSPPRPAAAPSWGWGDGG